MATNNAGAEDEHAQSLAESVERQLLITERITPSMHVPPQPPGAESLSETPTGPHEHMNNSKTTEDEKDTTTKSTTNSKKAFNEKAENLSEAQDAMQSRVAEVIGKTEVAIKRYTQLSEQMSEMEEDIKDMPDFDDWLTKTTSEISHMKSQILFLYHVMEEEYE